MEQSLESFSTWFRELYHLDKPDVREYSALTLAYIGDAVYEIIIRSYIVGKGNAPVERLHKRSSRLVREKCDLTASIPMKGDIDSLNASVAAGVLAYEIVRQRMGK